MVDIKERLARLEYPDGKQSAVWFPFFPNSSYEPSNRNGCEAFLVFKRGLPKVLVCPVTALEQYQRLALGSEIFSKSPPILLGYTPEQITAMVFKENTYSELATTPTWNQLDEYDSGCLSEARAEQEILAVATRMRRWLQDPLSEAAVQGLMRVHVQRGAIVQELIQNACDCFATEITFTLDGDTLVFRHDGHPFMPENVHAITALNLSCKPPGAIGYKGIGFKSVYQVCQRPEVSSWPFRFAFEPRNEDLALASQGMLCPYLPVVNKQAKYPPNGLTEFRLPLVQGQNKSIIESLQAVSGAMLLFIAAKGLSLRSMQILDHSIELPSDYSAQDGIVSVLDNGSPSSWFISRHEFTIDMDRQSALVDFSNTTSRIDFRNKPAKEQVVVAIPLSKDANGQLIPEAKHKGRFYSFLPTKDIYGYPWDINANFLVDEPRDHLRTPVEGSWNEALLNECGRALLCLLDAVRKTWKSDHTLPVPKYYNLIPDWSAETDDPQFATHFALMEKIFSLDFDSSPRVPIYNDVSLQFVNRDNCTFIESRFRALFPLETWLRFLPPEKGVVIFDLDEDVWQDFLCAEEGKAELYTPENFVTAMCQKDWESKIGIQPSSAEIIPLIGRVCAYLAFCGMSATDLVSAWVIPSSVERTLYRSTDMPDGKSIYRMPDDGLVGLPAHVTDNVTIVHDGVLRFLQHDTSYFKGDLASGITDEMATLGRRLWTGLVNTLDFNNILEWLNADYAVERDGEKGIVELRDEWLRFLLKNRNKLTGSAVTGLQLRLLARLNSAEVWNSPGTIWLSESSPQGIDIETFISNTANVALLSKRYTAILSSVDTDESSVGAFLIQLGIQHSIIAKQELEGWYYPGRDMAKFCQDLGIPTDSSPKGDINYNMSIYQYSLPDDVINALNDAISDTIPQRRAKRLNAFGRLIQATWQDRLKKACHKEGSYHLKGARDSAKLQGAYSNLALTIGDTEWVPLISDNKVLKRPRDTCLPTDESIKYSDLQGTANYADMWLEDKDLIEFLGFQSLPVGLSSIDAIRYKKSTWEESADPRKDFDDLYSRLASELEKGVSIEEAQKVFRRERLIFIPTRPPIFRSSEEVLTNAD